MPKRKSNTAAPPDTYDSDDGFVAHDDEDGGVRKSKKVKGGQGSKMKVEKGSVGGGGSVDKEGEVFWEVGLLSMGFSRRLGWCGLTGRT